MRLALLWLYCIAYMAFAERTVSLAWDANPAGDSVTGYVVTVDGKDQPSVATTSASVTIPDARATITVAAINASGRSAPSDPITIPAFPASPKGLRVSSIVRTTITTP